MKNGLLIGLGVGVAAAAAIYFAMRKTGSAQQPSNLVNASGDGGGGSGGSGGDGYSSEVAKANFTSSTGRALINPATGQPIAILQPGQNIRDVITRQPRKEPTEFEKKILSSVGVTFSEPTKAVATTTTPTKTTSTTSIFTPTVKTTSTKTTSTIAPVSKTVMGLFGTHSN